MMRPTEVGRRQLVVAFTDGRDSTSIIGESDLRAIARLTDAVVSIVVPIAAARGVETRRLSQRAGGPPESLAGAPNVSVNGRRPGVPVAEGVPPGLTDLVGPTGGQVLALGAEDSISRVFRSVLEDFRATYVLQYVVQGVDPSGWHEVEVVLKKHDRYDIRARKGYRGRVTIPAGEKP
jgi:hypothetical protein